MRTLTWDEFCHSVASDMNDGIADVQTDNSGQLIVYTNLFEWSDGSIRSEPDPSWDDDPTDA